MSIFDIPDPITPAVFCVKGLLFGVRNIDRQVDIREDQSVKHNLIEPVIADRFVPLLVAALIDAFRQSGKRRQILIDRQFAVQIEYWPAPWYSTSEHVATHRRSGFA